MGNNNTGHRNTGNWNTGDWNTGNCNTGHRNTGDWNTGNCNTGHRNTGDCNAGNWNTGHRNTGDCNAGNWNTGRWNTGDYNAGNWNTGRWNTGDYNAGYCNTITPDDCFIFNKPSKRSEWDNADKPKWIYVNLTRWVDESDMTDKEKEAYPSYTTTGGYLKVYSSLQHAYIEAWNNADLKDKKKTFNLPNFDRDVFKEIFGFYPDIEEEKKKIEINGVEIELTEKEKKNESIK